MTADGANTNAQDSIETLKKGSSTKAKWYSRLKRTETDRSILATPSKQKREQNGSVAKLVKQSIPLDSKGQVTTRNKPITMILNQIRQLVQPLPAHMKQYYSWERQFYQSNQNRSLPTLLNPLGHHSQHGSLPFELPVMGRRQQSSEGDMILRLTANLYAVLKRQFRSCWGYHRSKLKLGNGQNQSMEWLSSSRPGIHILSPIQEDCLGDMSADELVALRMLCLIMPVTYKSSKVFGMDDDTMKFSLHLQSSVPAVCIDNEHYVAITSVGMDTKENKLPNNLVSPIGFYVTFTSNIPYFESNVVHSTTPHAIHRDVETTTVPSSMNDEIESRRWLEDILIQNGIAPKSPVNTIAIVAPEWISTNQQPNEMDKEEICDEINVLTLPIYQIWKDVCLGRFPMAPQIPRASTFLQFHRMCQNTSILTHQLPLLSQHEARKLLVEGGKLLQVNETVDQGIEIDRYSNTYWMTHYVTRQKFRVWASFVTAISQRCLFETDRDDFIKTIQDELPSLDVSKVFIDELTLLLIPSLHHHQQRSVLQLISAPYWRDVPRQSLLDSLSPIDRSFFHFIEYCKLIPRHHRDLWLAADYDTDPTTTTYRSPLISSPLITTMLKESYRHALSVWHLLDQRNQNNNEAIISAIQEIALKQQLSFTLAILIAVLRLCEGLGSIGSHGPTDHLLKAVVKNSHQNAHTLSIILDQLSDLLVQEPKIEFGDWALISEITEDRNSTTYLDESAAPKAECGVRKSERRNRAFEYVSDFLLRSLLYRGLTVQEHTNTRCLIATPFHYLSHVHSPIPTFSTLFSPSPSNSHSSKFDVVAPFIDSNEEEEEEETHFDRIDLNRLKHEVMRWSSRQRRQRNNDHDGTGYFSSIRILGQSTLGVCGNGYAVRTPLDTSLYDMFPEYKMANSRINLESLGTGKILPPILTNWTSPTLSLPIRIHPIDPTNYYLNPVPRDIVLSKANSASDLMIAAGYHHIALVDKKDQILWLWGANQAGQLVGASYADTQQTEHNHHLQNQALTSHTLPAMPFSQYPSNNQYNWDLIHHPTPFTITRSSKRKTGTLSVVKITATRTATIIVTQCGRILVLGGRMDGLNEEDDDKKPLFVLKRKEWKKSALLKLFRREIDACCSGGGYVSIHSSSCSNYNGRGTKNHSLDLVQEPHFTDVKGGESHALALTSYQKQVVVWGRGEVGQLGLPLGYLSRMWKESEAELLKLHASNSPSQNIPNVDSIYGMVPLLARIRLFEVPAWTQDDSLSKTYHLSVTELANFVHKRISLSDTFLERHAGEIDVYLDIKRMVWVLNIPDEFIEIDDIEDIPEEIKMTKIWTGECNSFILGHSSLAGVPIMGQGRNIGAETARVLYGSGQMNSGQLALGLDLHSRECLLDAADALLEAQISLNATGARSESPLKVRRRLMALLKDAAEHWSIPQPALYRFEEDADWGFLLERLGNAVKWLLMPNLNLIEVLGVDLGSWNYDLTTFCGAREGELSRSVEQDGIIKLLHTNGMCPNASTSLHETGLSASSAIIQRGLLVDKIFTHAIVPERDTIAKYSFVPLFDVVHTIGEGDERGVEMSCGGTGMSLWHRNTGKGIVWGSGKLGVSKSNETIRVIQERCKNSFKLDESQNVCIFGNENVIAGPVDLPGNWKNIAITKGPESRLLGVQTNKCAQIAEKEESLVIAKCHGENVQDTSLQTYNQLEAVPDHEAVSASVLPSASRRGDFALYNIEKYPTAECHPLAHLECGLGFMVAVMEQTETSL